MWAEGESGEVQREREPGDREVVGVRLCGGDVEDGVGVAEVGGVCGRSSGVSKDKRSRRSILGSWWLLVGARALSGGRSWASSGRSPMQSSQAISESMRCLKGLKDFSLWKTDEGEMV